MLHFLMWTLKGREHNGQSSPAVVAAFSKAQKKEGMFSTENIPRTRGGQGSKSIIWAKKYVLRVQTCIIPNRSRIPTGELSLE